MALVLIIIGAIILIAGVRGTQTQQADGTPGLWELLQGDFSNSSQASQQHGGTSFIPWVFAILIVGAVGYIDELKGVSRGFMALIIIAMIIKAYQRNPNIFSGFNSAIGINPTGIAGL